MLNLGFSEISLIAVLALLLFGPEKMPEFAKTVARFVKEFRRMSAELQSTVHETVATIDNDALRAPSLREVYERVDPKRAIEEIGIRPFADPTPGSVDAPPAVVSTDAYEDVGQAMAAPSLEAPALSEAESHASSAPPEPARDGDALPDATVPSEQGPADAVAPPPA